MSSTPTACPRRCTRRRGTGPRRRRRCRRGRPRDEVADQRRALLRALAESDRRHLRERADGGAHRSPHRELGAGDERRRDRTESDGEHAEAAFCWGNRSGLGRRQRRPVERRARAWRLGETPTYHRFDAACRPRRDVGSGRRDPFAHGEDRRARRAAAPPRPRRDRGRVGFLTGEPRQGRIGVGWATLAAIEVAPAAEPHRRRSPTSTTPSRAVAATRARIAAAAPRCSPRRSRGRPTPEADFVVRLLTG